MDEILRGAVAAVHAAFADAAVDVAHQAWAGQDALGTRPPPPAPVTRKAVVTEEQGLLRTPNGEELRYRAKVSFVEPVDVDARDRLTLPDGLTGPLYVPQGGTLDPSTGKPYARTVFIR